MKVIFVEALLTLRAAKANIEYKAKALYVLEDKTEVRYSLRSA